MCTAKRGLSQEFLDLDKEPCLSFEFLLTANKVGKGNNRFSKGADALQRCSMGAEQEKQILYQRFNNDATMVQQSVH